MAEDETKPEEEVEEAPKAKKKATAAKKKTATAEKATEEKAVTSAEPKEASKEAKEETPTSTEESDKPKKGEKPKDIFAELDPGEGDAPKVLKAKGSKNVTTGIVHVRATFNNTMVTVTDAKGNSLGWSSSGKMGFRGSRKSTAYAAQVVCQDACRQAMSHGLKEAEVRVKGPGTGRESAVRAVQGLGIQVTTIKDVTPIPHNGCRPKKPRRV